MSNKWYAIIENDSFIVEYNKETNTYRVSYFEDNHFKDEICFRGYKELEWKEEAPEAEKTWTTDELQKEIQKIMEPPYIYQDTDTIAIQNSVNGVTFTAENSKFDLDTFVDRYCYFCEHQNACPGPLTHLQTCEHKDKMKEGEVK